MSLTLGKGLVGRTAASWSPAELTLTGFWDKGNYTAGAWPGLPSAGPSAGQDLSQAIEADQPTAVAAEPDFDGISDNLTIATLLSDFLTVGEGTVAVLAYVDSAVAPASGYDEPAFMSDAGAGNFTVSINTSGVAATVYDGAFKTVTAAAPVGALFLAIVRWDGVNLGVAVNGGAEVTLACGSIWSLAAAMNVGTNYANLAFLDGRIRTLLTMQTKISDVDAAKVLNWAQTQRELS